jgi:primosomal protein N' (replication factor Y)
MEKSPIKYVDVILPLPVDGYFTYWVPKELDGNVMPGNRVVIQFGSKKFYSALVRKVHGEKPEGYETKPVEAILDSEPVVPESCFELWEWMAGYYHCPVGEVLKAALPSGLKLESETRITYNPEFIEVANCRLTPREELLFEVIRDKKSLSVFELNNSVLKKGTLPVIKELLNKGAISVEEEIREGYKQKKETFISVAPEFQDEIKLQRTLDLLHKVPKQQDLLTFMLQQKADLDSISYISLLKKDLLYRSGISTTVLNGLIKKGILATTEKTIDRIEQSEGQSISMNELSIAQQKAYEEIIASFGKNMTTLLHGITSSGKTEIYIKLIDSLLAQGKQVLYLLPEIGLTTQIINRLKRFFGNKVGVYHSKFNDAERVEIWNKVLNFNSKNTISDHQLIVGARSAVFLPFKNLGLIIVDEEHETSYKQFDPSPRYHARDAAVVLGHLKKIPVLLGTATPSVETYFNATTGKYGLVELKERHLNIELPKIITADFKEAYRRKQMRSHLTPELFDQITEALKQNEQVILFQNRRGFSPFVECKSCGWVPKCNHCDVSLTFHKHNNTLVCHYCGYSMANPSTCRSCGHKDISAKGFGTEKVEEELTALFPDAIVERMDLDSTRSKKAYENIIQRFENGAIDILVGTQMVTKGLDFENVSLVGILNADNLLNFPDFRAYERSFQLMAQVSGRAGRKYKQGKVVIQTTEPNHSIIKQVIENDYKGMFKTQIAERKFFKYPPFYRLVSIILKHRDKAELDRIAGEAAIALQSRFGKRLLGPEYPAVSRIKMLYIKQMWLKLEREISITNAKRQMQQMLDEVKSKAGNKTVQMIIDVDPM